MGKIKRNDPCPCGSGKKYKFCCGFNNPVNTNVKRTNEELDQLHQAFIRSLSEDYAGILADLQERFAVYDMGEDEETAQIYQTGLSLWLLFYVSFDDNNRSIFTDFYKRKTAHVSSRARQLFLSWQDELPSVYEVKQIDENSRLLTVENYQTKTPHDVPYHPSEDFTEGTLLIGTLVPFTNQYGFFFTIIKLFRHDPERIKQLLMTYTEQEGGLRIHFPQFLADALLLGKEASEWDKPIHEEVAQLFADHLINKQMKDDVLFKGVELWEQYTQKEKPSLRKAEPYAAALEYLVQKDWLGDETITQDQLASEYGCTPGSISSNYRKIADVWESSEILAD